MKNPINSYKRYVNSQTDLRLKACGYLFPLVAAMAVALLFTYMESQDSIDVSPTEVEYSESESFKREVINYPKITRAAEDVLVKENFSSDKLLTVAKTLCPFVALGEGAEEHLPSILTLVITRDLKLDLSIAEEVSEAISSTVLSTGICDSEEEVLTTP